VRERHKYLGSVPAMSGGFNSPTFENKFKAKWINQKLKMKYLFERSKKLNAIFY